MRSATTWFDEYGESHRNPTNKLLHWICVPIIVVSSIGLLMALPVPAAMRAVSPWLNWGTLLAGAALVYYFFLSPRLALAMLPILWLVFALLYWLAQLPVPLWITCVIAFALAWLGQFVGHVIEGKRPSFFKDLQFLLIGPLWLLAHLFRRAGISY